VTIEDALASALAELGVGRDDVDVETIQQPGTSAGDADAVIRVTVRAAPQDARANNPDLEQLEEQADAAADFLDEMLSLMDIDAIAEPHPEGLHMYVDIVDGPEDDMSLLIGRHGQTLEAIQELTRMAVSRRLDQRVRVIIDVEDYRKRRESRLEERARELAERAVESGRDQELEPMNSYERKLVHDAASSVGGVETISRGEEPGRYVVIRPL
jgi:spoIIIJ-associated protein